MKKRKNILVVIVAILLFAVVFMNIFILYNHTQKQSRQEGVLQLATVSEKMENAFGDAELLTTELAIKAREYLDDKEQLEKFIYAQKKEIVSNETGVFNIYIAGSDFAIIPDFDMPDDYNATERVWYKGAVKSKGQPYVSPPYQDAMTGEICYSVSVALGDNDTVLSIDYTMEGVRSYVARMADNAVRAVIVTDEGIIAGCSDESQVGSKLVAAVPDYAGIYARVRKKTGVTTARIRDGYFFENLFAMRSGNGWYLIVGVSDWRLYKDSYIQFALTIFLSVVLFIVVITSYLLAQKNREKAEIALRSREEFINGITAKLNDPLTKILDYSSEGDLSEGNDYKNKMLQVHLAGKSLSEMINQIMSYKSIIAAEKKTIPEKNSERKGLGVNKRFRSIIISVLILSLCVSMYICISSAYQWGKMRMQNESMKYEDQLAGWINKEKSILDMFVSVFSTNPNMLSDYDGTVKYLNDITSQYPEISVTYMTNPNLEHTVYMSNGWEPEEGWHVEERQWYIDTLASKKGFSVSAPYYDEQTGGYCLTISETVYDAKTGEFMGVFGIDFFMDKLVDILGDSYLDEGYAFLVDPEGEIINHPYGAYQMTQDKSINIQTSPYGEIRADGKMINLIKDYDGLKKILIADRNKDSNFTVYVVLSAWEVYGKAILYAFVCFVTFMICIILVYNLLTHFIIWQEDINQKLKESAEAAISAGNAKSNFLAQMSHEIRTPINAVLGMNEMILRESDDEDITEYAENIRSAGKTLLSLINSILDFSKIEDGKMELVPAEYDTASLINDLVNSISQRAKGKGLEFITDADSNLPSVLFGDDVRIKQIIMNLLTNAVKYTEKGTVTFSIHGKRCNEKEMYLCVSVKDTGIGIREEDREKLFESFSRLDETTNRNIEGTGLGMAIVTKLLDMMESTLDLKSEYGEGSEFSFELKQEIVNDEPIGDFTDRLRRHEEHDITKKNLLIHDARVLVVDDNEMNLKVARNLMKRNGIVPDEAASGMEAIEKMTENTYDIVFLDHMMPKMDGVETLKKLKESNLVPEGCVVIALTANAISGAREKYLEAGFDDYISKPIEVEVLEKKLMIYIPENKVSWETDEKNQKEEFIMEFAPYDENDDVQYEKNYMEGDIQGSLTKLGIDVEKAISFCGDNYEMYSQLLDEYSRSAIEKKAELDDYYMASDWHNFEIQIHALKSTSKTLGIMDISEKALLLEKAAREENEEYIKRTYAKFALEYEKIAEEIYKVIIQDS